MRTAIITVGISASGKTTWADEHARQALRHTLVISRDVIRRQILESKLNRPLKPGELWSKWKFKNENEVTAIAEIELKNFIDKGSDIIFADTNLNKGRRDALVARLEAAGFTVELKLFPVSYEDAIKRDAGRADGVGQAVLWRQYTQWFSEFGIFPKYVPDRTLPSCVLFDVDGTLANMDGKRGPFEWNKVLLDSPRVEIVEMARAFKSMGHKIVIMSGRDSISKGDTIQWLQNVGVPYDAIFMRGAGDSRKDWIVKGELFYANVATSYNAMMVIDDRPQVCELWWLIGVSCASVGEPNVRF